MLKILSNAGRVILGLTVFVLGGCLDGPSLLNQIAKLGGDTAGTSLNSGGRGNVDVLFVNNTPFRAIFTTGVFDPLDEVEVPFFSQFTGVAAGITLEGNTSSNFLLFPCARVFSVGSRQLLDRMSDTMDDATTPPDDEALLEGVGFSSAPIGSVKAGLPTEGRAMAREVFIGDDFLCGSSLIFRLEFDDAGTFPFRVDFEVVIAEDERGN